MGVLNSVATSTHPPGSNTAPGTSVAPPPGRLLSPAGLFTEPALRIKPGAGSPQRALSRGRGARVVRPRVLRAVPAKVMSFPVRDKHDAGRTGGRVEDQLVAPWNPERTPSVPPDLATSLVELANLMMATPTVVGMLDDLCRLAAGVLTPPASCGITLRQDHLPLTVASSDPLAAHMDEAQYGQDEGPCCTPCAPAKSPSSTTWPRRIVGAPMWPTPSDTVHEARCPCR